MLKKIQPRKLRSTGGRFALVAAQYNARYVDAMLQAARTELEQAGAADVVVVRVPGAFEIPVVIARLARQSWPGFDAILALGVILRGETAHAQLIADGVTAALAQIQVLYGVPAIHGVLLLDTEEQARVRCLSRDHNRGREAAHTALAMAQVMSQCPSDGTELVAVSASERKKT